MTELETLQKQLDDERKARATLESNFAKASTENADLVEKAKRLEKLEADFAAEKKKSRIKEHSDFALKHIDPTHKDRVVAVLEDLQGLETVHDFAVGDKSVKETGVAAFRSLVEEWGKERAAGVLKSGNGSTRRVGKDGTAHGSGSSLEAEISDFSGPIEDQEAEMWEQAQELAIAKKSNPYDEMKTLVKSQKRGA